MIVEIIGGDTVRVYGATIEDAQWNAAQFQREFIAERFKGVEGCHVDVANSNGKEYFCEIMFRPRWQRVREEEIRGLRGKHSNGNNASFVGFLRRLMWDAVLVDEVVVRQWGKEAVLCQKCSIQHISSLSRDDEEGDQTVWFITNNDPQKTVQCPVYDIVYILIKSATGGEVALNYSAETNMWDTVRVYGRTADEVQTNVLHFRREFIGQRWKRIEAYRYGGIPNSNGRECAYEIIFRQRWRQNGDFDLSALRGQHSNGDNTAFANFLHLLTKEEVLIDRVVSHQFDDDVVLCQKCYVVDVRLLTGQEAGQAKVWFNSRRYADYRNPATVECLVGEIDHIWI